MRIKTIWTIQNMALTERVRQSIDWFALKSATKLPKRIRYWAAVSSIAKASGTGPYADMDSMTAPLEYVLKNLDGGPK